MGLLTCRVAAVGAIRGEWADIVVNAGGDFDTPGQVQPVLVEPFTGDALKVRWEPQPAAARYVVRVISRGTGVRSLYLDRTITQYSYHYTDAQQDAAGRTLTVKVAAENGNGVLGAYGELTATNPPPAVPDNVEVTGLLNTLMVQCRHPKDTDLRELRVYGEQRSGFTPSPANLLATSPNALLSVTVPTNTQWWVRLAWVDQWGATDLNFSGEFEAEASQILETVIKPDSIETPMLKANCITSEKVLGETFTGREFNAAMTVTAGTGSNTAGMNGSHSENSMLSNLAFWAGASINNLNAANFLVDKSGNLTANNAQINNGTFTGSVSVGGSIAGSSISGGNIKGALIEGAIIVASEKFTTNVFDLGSGNRYFYLPSYFCMGSRLNNSYYRFDIASGNYNSEGVATVTYAGQSVKYYKPMNRTNNLTVKVNLINATLGQSGIASGEQYGSYPSKPSNGRITYYIKAYGGSKVSFTVMRTITNWDVETLTGGGVTHYRWSYNWQYSDPSPTSVIVNVQGNARYIDLGVQNSSEYVSTMSGNIIITPQ